MGKSKKGNGKAELDRLIEEIMTDAHGDDECYVAFLTVLEDATIEPCPAIVLGEEVMVQSWVYDGNGRRGVTAKVSKPGGKVFEVAAWEVVLPDGAAGERELAAYRKWLGMGPAGTEAVKEKGKPKKAKASVEAEARAKTSPKTEMTVEVNGHGGVVELAVLAVGARALECRGVDGGEITCMAVSKGIVPGEIIRVTPEKRWVYDGQENIAGEISEARIDVRALGLKPLELRPEGKWDPRDMDWGEDGPSIEEWTKMLPVNAKGKRQQYEMEQVVPGANFAEEIDPIMEANELKESGDTKGARKVLMALCTQDLRCLDAHAHLGNLVYRREPEVAVKHYEVGVRIGELSLGEGFDGVLPWIMIDNRPFLRCLHGYGIALWRLRKFKEAEEVFRRMILLNPQDNQGVRFLIDDVRKKNAWREDMY